MWLEIEAIFSEFLLLSSTAQFLSPIYSWGDKDEKKKVESRGKLMIQ